MVEDYMRRCGVPQTPKPHSLIFAESDESLYLAGIDGLEASNQADDDADEPEEARNKDNSKLETKKILNQPLNKTMGFP